MMKKRPLPAAPCVHTQAEKEVLPPYSLGQFVHASVPVVTLYFPSAHTTHELLHDWLDELGRY